LARGDARLRIFHASLGMINAAVIIQGLSFLGFGPEYISGAGYAPVTR
jgi:hypothetical protein